MKRWSGLAEDLSHKLLLSNYKHLKFCTVLLVLLEQHQQCMLYYCATPKLKQMLKDNPINC